MGVEGKSATFRFYAELNDFLEPQRRGREIRCSFRGSFTVKDAIETLGVPVSAVELVLVGGRSVDFDFRLDDGDRVAVYPMFEAVDVSSLLRVRKRPLRQTRFVVDETLPGLARLLRRIGFDVLEGDRLDLAEIVRISVDQGRIVLTRDPGLLEERALTHGYRVRADTARAQLDELLSRLDLQAEVSQRERIRRPRGSPRRTAASCPPADG